jgi:hypothetical protein
VIEAGEIRIFIDQSIVKALPNAIVGVEPPHGRIVVTPAQP